MNAEEWNKSIVSDCTKQCTISKVIYKIVLFADVYYLLENFKPFSRTSRNIDIEMTP